MTVKTIDKDAILGPVHLGQADTLMLQLKEHGGAAYEWRCSSEDSLVVEVVGDRLIGDDGNSMGGIVVREVRCVARHCGATTIRCVLLSPFDEGDVAERWSCDVNVS